MTDNARLLYENHMIAEKNQCKTVKNHQSKKIDSFG